MEYETILENYSKKDLDYEKISTETNIYAINKIKEILAVHRKNMTPNQIERFNKALEEGFIVKVDKPNIEDIKRWKDKVPTAHGGRGKEDGYIHIYPYTNPRNTEDNIKNYINEGIITHELFHFIIQMDFKNDNNEYSKEEEEFGHYLTEGFVQLLTEQLEGRKFDKIQYRKNIEMAYKIYKELEELGYENIINTYNYMEISNNYLDLTKYLEKYKKETEVWEYLEEIITTISNENSLKSNCIIGVLKGKSMEEVFTEFKKAINAYYKDSTKYDFYMTEIENIENYYNDDTKKMTL